MTVINGKHNGRGLGRRGGELSRRNRQDARNAADGRVAVFEFKDRFGPASDAAKALRRGEVGGRGECQPPGQEQVWSS